MCKRNVVKKLSEYFLVSESTAAVQYSCLISDKYFKEEGVLKLTMYTAQ
jgi:hypothetical protein